MCVERRDGPVPAIESYDWSRRELLVRGGVGVMAIGLAAGCQPAAKVAEGDQSAALLTGATRELPTVTPVPFTAAEPIAAPSLARKVAQMLMVGFRGTVLDDNNPIVADIRERGIGSVVLFSYDVVLQSPLRNVESPAQVQALNASLQALATIPLLIAVDQEGGKVARLNETHGFPPTFSAQALGDRADVMFTYAQAAQMAKTLAATGINQNLAPAVDVNTNPTNPVIGLLGRSFSGDPASVTAQAHAFIDAHHAHKITTTIKHFPGHGSSRADSHKGFVDITDTWQPLELEPYRVLIAEGIVDTVMTGHVFNAKLDPVYPSTLSKPILTGILREQLGFTGVIITDDMGMKAITDNFGFAEAVVKAVQAGADMLALGNNLSYDPAVAERTIDILVQAVAAGVISEQRIDESYARIMDLKKRWAT